jgi:hypothetical protein
LSLPTGHRLETYDFETAYSAPRISIGEIYMKLSQLAEIHRQVGHEKLVSALEEFSQAEKARILEDISLAPHYEPKLGLNTREASVNVQPGDGTLVGFRRRMVSAVSWKAVERM